MTRDGSTVRLYIDGVLELEDTTANSADIAYNGSGYDHSRTAIGRSFPNGLSGIEFSMEGRIAQVGVWSRALSTGEVATLAGTNFDTSLTGLVGHWPLDEGTGEFVEVYNDGSSPIDLWGLIIYDGDAWDFIREYQGGSTVVQPGEYAVIIDQDYTGQYSIPAGVTVVTVDDGSIGSGLAASSDEVYLYEADGYSVIDAYAFPFNPGNGVSAERIDLSAADAPSNWQGSTCASSSSPGAVNCL